jgi:hypothetical protein
MRREVQKIKINCSLEQTRFSGRGRKGIPAVCILVSEQVGSINGT